MSRTAPPPSSVPSPTGLPKQPLVRLGMVTDRQGDAARGNSIQASDGTSIVFMQLGDGVGGPTRSFWYHALATAATNGQRRGDLSPCLRRTAAIDDLPLAGLRSADVGRIRRRMCAPEPLFRTRSSVEETRSCSMPTASSPKAHPVKLRPLVVLARACSLELATLSGAPAR